jgi:hypothetical protein
MVPAGVFIWPGSDILWPDTSIIQHEIAIPDRQCDLVRISYVGIFFERGRRVIRSCSEEGFHMYHGRHPCYWKDSFECASAWRRRNEMSSDIASPRC